MSKSNAQSSTNAKLLSVLAENGTEFRPEQKIIFNLDPSIGWLKSKESYLVFDILNYSATNLRLQLAHAGISSVIKRVDIYSKESGTLLETLQDYNKWTATQIQYSQDDKNNVANMEGVPYPNNCSKSANNTNPRVYRDNLRNPSWTETVNNRVSPLVRDANALSPSYTSVRFTTPLRCGVFREWDDEKLVPILMMGGLRIELTLAPAREVWTSGMTGIVNGAHAQYYGDANGHGSVNSVATGAPIAFQETGEAAGTALVNATDFTMTAPCAPDACPFAVGNKVSIVGTSAGGPISTDTTITSVSVVGSSIEVVCGAAVGTALTSGCSIALRDIQDTDLGYRITNCEFRIMREDPPNVPMKNTEYIYTTYDMFRDTIPQNQLNFTSDITSTSSQALSIFTMYENPIECANTMLGMNNYYAGLTAGETGFSMNQIVYFINNKLYPLRPYDPRCVGDKVITQNELVKAWGTLGIVPRCLGSAHGSDSTIYTNRFLHARELARGQAVFNLQNAEPQIRLGFQQNRQANGKGSTIASVNMFSFVFSKRTLQIDGETGLTLLQ